MEKCLNRQAQNVKTRDNGYYYGAGIHEMGTAKMGRDKETSVLTNLIRFIL